MSTVYQSTEDVKQYVEIESTSSGGGANKRSEKYEYQSSEGRITLPKYRQDRWKY
jgi:hypothetical protein